MSDPAVWPIDVVGGTTFDETYTYYTDTTLATPVNLTGYGARLMIRVNEDDDLPTLSITSSADANPATNPSYLDGHIVLGGAAGTVQVILTPQGTGKVADAGSGQYDLVLDAGGLGVAPTEAFMAGPVRSRQGMVR